jgi:error-prone DNA polymerase
VHVIVHYARSQNILCQGRGSAANSAVCYVLGITSVDPTRSIAVRRFISRSGWSRPTSTSISSIRGAKSDAICLPPLWPPPRRDHCHRHPLPAAQRGPRCRQGAGLTEDVTAALADTCGKWGKGLNGMQVRQAGLDPQNAMIELAVAATEL